MGRVVSDRIDVGRRFPEVPILGSGGRFLVCEFHAALSGLFGPVLAALVTTYDDEVAEFVDLEPSPERYRSLFGREPEFQMRGADIAGQYTAGLMFEPRADISGAFAYTSDVFAIAGSSGAWAVWGERDWEVALVWTRDPDGPWTGADVLMLDPFESFEEIRPPSAWGMTLPDDVLATFRGNLRSSLTR